MAINKKDKAKKDKLRIGEHLVKVGAVTDADIQLALENQQSTNDKIGQILQTKGSISAYRFYKEYAKFKEMEFVNLEEDLFDSKLLVENEKNGYLEYQYVPISEKDVLK